jgi:hypothetical protein
MVCIILLSGREYCIVQRELPGMMSAAASLGLSLLWDTEVGLTHVDKYSYSAEEYIKVSE